MSRTVFCKKLGMEETGLEHPPFPGEFGKEIYDHISKQAWQMWLSRQTMLINEYRLNMSNADSRKFILKAMQEFLFSEDSAPPPGYTPIE